jgi:hypothetical protein
MLYGAAIGGSITFINEGIKFQMPLLLGTVAVKYIALALN